MLQLCKKGKKDVKVKEENYSLNTTLYHYHFLLITTASIIRCVGAKEKSVVGFNHYVTV